MEDRIEYKVHIKLTKLEEIDLRLSLFLQYLPYRINMIANKQKNIASFEQWLCANRYSSLVED